MLKYFSLCFTNYADFWIPYLIVVAFIFLIATISLLENRSYIKSLRKRGSADEKLTLVVPIAKTVYTVVGHFSKTSKVTAKSKIERLIKKEIQK